MKVLFSKIIQILLSSCQAIADAEDRMVASMFKKEDKSDSNKG